LYPHQNSWYKDKIKIHISKDQNRYLRYIKDDDAVNFINMVQRVDIHNLNTHNWFAKQIAGKYHHFVILQKHHYFMPSSSSVAIGTFVVNENDLIPIFSDRGKEIALVKAKNKWSINIGNQKKILIPHGWGQEFINPPKNINVDFRNTKITIGSESFGINEKESFVREKIAKIRDFKNQEDFFESGSNFIDVTLVETIIPEKSISKYGFDKQF